MFLNTPNFHCYCSFGYSSKIGSGYSWVLLLSFMKNKTWLILNHDHHNNYALYYTL